MKIIHLISDISQVNFGIWNAALNTAAVLNRDYQVESEAWYPATAGDNPMDGYEVEPMPLDPEEWKHADILISERSLSRSDTIIHSHGCWMAPTRIADKLKSKGFRWLFTPHGMLEPWSRQQKKLKKDVYFWLFERKYISRCDMIRAVGTPEKHNLDRLFPGKEVALVPNGIETATIPINNHPKKAGYSPWPIKVLFLSRLHHKKGLIPMINAWKDSSLFRDDRYKLVIAGPDDGELDKMMSLLKQMPDVSNIEYIGAVYGEQKEMLLQESSYFILPSFSEGFPTSIVEAMSYGCIPIISDGCNFPEVFSEGLAIKTTPREADIITALEKVRKLPPDKTGELSARGRLFVTEQYSLKKIAELQYELYEKMLQRQT
jgi:glycosyltransferase involved in cell wall biosynthesis